MVLETAAEYTLTTGKQRRCYRVSLETPNGLAVEFEIDDLRAVNLLAGPSFQSGVAAVFHIGCIPAVGGIRGRYDQPEVAGGCWPGQKVI